MFQEQLLYQIINITLSEEIKQALSNVERKAKEHREKKEQEELER